MEAMDYELFLRHAFSIDRDTLIDTEDDPAGLSTAVYFDDADIAMAKIGAGYAFSIYINDLLTHESHNLEEGAYGHLRSFVTRLLECESLPCIHRLIMEFNEVFVNKFYPRKSAGGSETK